MSSNVRTLTPPSTSPSVIAPREPKRVNTLVDVRHELHPDLGSFVLGGSSTTRYQRLKDGLWYPATRFSAGEGRTWEQVLAPTARTRAVVATVARATPRQAALPTAA